MRQKAPKQVKSGDPIRAEDWNLLVEMVCRNSIDVGSSFGLDIRQGPGGTVIGSVITPNSNGQLAITDGTITARSGTTPGTGTVFDVYYDGSVLVTDTTTKTVLSYSSTTGGIATGVYCWIVQDDDGNWWIISVDCGN